jgi:hypothetical protein
MYRTKTLGLLMKNVLQWLEGKFVSESFGCPASEKLPGGAGNCEVPENLPVESIITKEDIPVVTAGSFFVDKTAGAWSWSLTSIQCRCQEWRNYISTPHMHSWRDVYLNKHRGNFTFCTIWQTTYLHKSLFHFEFIKYFEIMFIVK